MSTYDAPALFDRVEERWHEDQRRGLSQDEVRREKELGRRFDALFAGLIPPSTISGPLFTQDAELANQVKAIKLCKHIDRLISLAAEVEVGAGQGADERQAELMAYVIKQVTYDRVRKVGWGATNDLIQNLAGDIVQG